jgi:hypothetical protein
MDATPPDPRLQCQGKRIVKSHGHRECPRLVADDVDRPLRHVASGDEPLEVNEGRLHLQGAPQPYVLVMVRVRPPVAVSKQSILGGLVLVGPWPPGDGGSRRDREGDAGSHDCRLEDALGSHEWDLATFEDEAVFQLRSGDHPAVVASVSIKESKGSRPDGLVVTSHSVGSRAVAC